MPTSRQQAAGPVLLNKTNDVPAEGGDADLGLSAIDLSTRPGGGDHVVGFILCIDRLDIIVMQQDMLSEFQISEGTQIDAELIIFLHIPVDTENS